MLISECKMQVNPDGIHDPVTVILYAVIL